MFRSSCVPPPASTARADAAIFADVGATCARRLSQGVIVPDDTAGGLC